MIYEIDGEFCISSSQVWLPGIYDTRRAANYAFRFSFQDLTKLSEKGVITFKDLQQEYARNRGGESNETNKV